jgi:hypothetical protein
MRGGDFAKPKSEYRERLIRELLRAYPGLTHAEAEEMFI